MVDAKFDAEKQLDMSIETAIASITEAEVAIAGMAEAFKNICKHRLAQGLENQLRSCLGPAVIYQNHVLPESLVLVQSLKDAMEFYMDVSFEEWLEDLPVLQEEVQDGLHRTTGLIKLYDHLVSALEQQTTKLHCKAHDLQEDAEEQKREAKRLQEDAGYYRVGRNVAGVAAIGAVAWCPITWLGIAVCGTLALWERGGRALAHGRVFQMIPLQQANLMPVKKQRTWLIPLMKVLLSVSENFKSRSKGFPGSLRS